eukprot:gnl/MRDRNA2_/MRDRNA2_97200_c0_seq1.p1 gnl/MRDRNA2_/MRDRNA2_97200_c0~~gnl/MRDRNA2_/MRDRNA2_97200_c0_seq1.p1  ORF type:complete len:381 (+),score=72.66 gnl/MRDRNA2_/MRDRNA2_97200_c0_seq1:79-1221(+)
MDQDNQSSHGLSSEDEDPVYSQQRRLSGVFEKNEIVGIDQREEKMHRLERDNQHLREIIRMYEDMTLQHLESSGTRDTEGTSLNSASEEPAQGVTAPATENLCAPTAENLGLHDENLSLKTKLDKEKAKGILLLDEREELKNDLRKASDLLDKLVKKFVQAADSDHQAQQNGKDRSSIVGDLYSVGEEASIITWSKQISSPYIAFSEDDTVASYESSSKNTDLRCYVVTDIPLEFHDSGAYFEVRIEKTSPDIQDPVGLAIGVTTTPPSQWPKALPGTADEIDRMWLVGYDGDMWDGANQKWTTGNWSGAHLIAGDRVGLQVNTNGCLHLFANGRLVLNGPTGIPTKDTALYGVIDLLGRTDSVKLIPKSAPNRSTLEVG